MEAMWREWRRRSGGGGCVEEKAVAWRLGDFNVREAFVFCMWRERWRCGGGGGGVEEKAVAWRLRDFNVRERGICVLYFVFYLFN